MSPIGYTVAKHHSYAHNAALKGTLHDTTVSLPGYAFEAVPFRWMNRESLAQEIGHERVPRFNQTRGGLGGRCSALRPPVGHGRRQPATAGDDFEKGVDSGVHDALAVTRAAAAALL